MTNTNLKKMFTTLTVAGSLFATFAPMTAFAAGEEVNDGMEVAPNATGDATGDATSHAQFKVENGGLYLTAVPDLDFGTIDKAHTVAESGEVLSLAENGSAIKTDEQKTSNVTYNVNDKVTVTDYQATAGQWALSAQLGAFSGLNDSAQPTLKLGEGFESLTAGADAKTLTNFTTADHDKSGIHDYSVKGATLSFAKGAVLNAGTHTAELTWTLTNSATTTAAE